MDLIGQYGCGSDSDTPAPLPSVVTAPEVDTIGYTLVQGETLAMAAAQHFQNAGSRSMPHNLPVSQMHAPVQGPLPSSGRGFDAAARNHRSGHVQDAHVSGAAFDEQFNSFHATNEGLDPEGRGERISVPGAEPTAAAASQKRQRESRENGAVGGSKASRPAPSVSLKDMAPFRLTSRQPWAEEPATAAPTTEAEGEAEPAASTAPVPSASTSRTFALHGVEAQDWQGRSWLSAPAHVSEPEACFLPKRAVHSWSGHTKGVSSVRFFPGTGHVLLSAGLDGKLKMWDVVGSRGCLATYSAHSKGVRDAEFSPSGSRFASCAYDRSLKVWDAETGSVLLDLGAGVQSYVARFHPDEAQQALLAGTADKKIVQYDLRTGDAVQQYDYHLGAVNAVCFVDEARRFVSASDDKTIRVWEFGIPVQIKVIADPAMHAVSAAQLAPGGKFWVAQSADNQLLTYSAGERVRPVKKKTFAGHVVAGYACQPSFSHDGRYLTSGDGDGKVFFWDWGSAKIARTLAAHKGVCIGTAWHPLRSSCVATCGWDGLVKIWD